MNNVGIMLLIGKLTWIHKEDKNSKKEKLQLTRADPQCRTAEQQVADSRYALIHIQALEVSTISHTTGVWKTWNAETTQ